MKIKDVINYLQKMVTTQEAGSEPTALMFDVKKVTIELEQDMIIIIKPKNGENND